ncbi:MAG TPA: FtsX-like permease family protein [Chitinophagales bacterium]|nr:FtsX-like permease family protein [Chitinophagales bacterium]
MLAYKFAFRYIFSKKSTNAINIIARVSMVGMAVGAFALIVVLSVFNGFEGLVVSLYDSFYPDVEVSAAVGKNFEDNPALLKKIEAVNGVTAVSRVLEENAYFEYGNHAQLGAVKGVDSHYNQVTTVNRFVRQGSFLLKDSSFQYAVIGANIGLALNVNIDRSIEPLKITVPRRGVKSAFLPEDEFNSMPVVPSGIFSIQQEFDSKYVFVSLDFARRLLDLDNRVSGYEIQLKPGANLNKTKQIIAAIAGKDFKVKTRYEQKAETYRVMLIERWVTTAILGFIILIISFNIIGSLSMLVLEKSRDISILKAMGADTKLISRIYLLNGMLASVIGAGIGMSAGYALCLLQIKFHFLKLSSGGDSSFVIDYYPVQLKLADFLVTITIIISVSLLAAYFPARRAGQSQMNFK